MNKYYAWCSLFVLSTMLLCSADDLYHAGESQETHLDEAMLKSSPRDKNIGYNQSNLPVPPSSICLNPQVFLIPDTTTTIYSGTAVEPSIAVNPTNKDYVVAVWQQGRINNGGALELGIARSTDGGHHWDRQTIPFQNCIGGFTQRITDPWLSYSRDGSILYLAALPFNATLEPNTENQQGIVVARSTDNGKTWSNPHWVAASQDYPDEPTGSFASDDKCSITADSNITLNAYCVWDRFPTIVSLHSDTLLSRTTDGGVTWSPHQTLYDPFLDPGLMSNGIYNDCWTINNIVVSLPQAGPNGGDLLNFMIRIYAAPGATDEEFANDSWPFQFTLMDIAFVRSQDQGVTWDTQATVIASLPLDPIVFTGGYEYDEFGNVIGGIGTQMRTGDILPSFTVNSVNGNLYAVWQTTMFREDQLPQIALAISRDGGFTWSEPAQVSQTPQDAPNPQAFTPFVAVDEHGHVGVLYSDFRKDTMSNPDKTKSDTWLAIFREVNNPIGGSTGIGLDFRHESRLSKKSYIAQNGPDTTDGVMTNGDYSFLVAVGKRFYAIYTQSFKGPFAEPEVVLSLPDNIVLLLDNNFRTGPFFSRVKAS